MALNSARVAPIAMTALNRPQKIRPRHARAVAWWWDPRPQKQQPPRVWSAGPRELRGGRRQLPFGYSSIDGAAKHRQHHDPKHRDRQEPGRPRHGIVDPRSDAGAISRDRTHHRRRKRSYTNGHPQTKNGHRREKIRPELPPTPGSRKSAKPSAAIKGPTISGSRWPRPSPRGRPTNATARDMIRMKGSIAAPAAVAG